MVAPLLGRMREHRTGTRGELTHGAERVIRIVVHSALDLPHTWRVIRSERASPQGVVQLGDMIDLCAAAATAGLLVMIYSDRVGIPRLLLALGFTFFVPGRVIVSNWPRVSAWSEAAIAMVFSVGALTLLAMITLWAHLWHPLGLLSIEAWLSLLGLGVAVVRRHELVFIRFGRS